MAEEEPLEDEKQEPEKPEKPRKQKVGLSMPIIIGGVLGILLLLFAAVVLGGFVATKLFSPENAGEKTEKVEEKPKSPEEEHFDEGDANKEDEEKRYFEEHPSKFAETGRITTNPKNSSQFVVINIGLEFREESKEEADDGHGGGGGTETLPPKILARIKGIVIQMLGSMTIVELQQNRGKLSEMLFEEIKPVFLQYRSKKMFLRDLVIVEFIIQ